MSRASVLALAAIAIALSAPRGKLAAQTDVRDPVFEAMGLQPNREYFSQLPFEQIDALSGNLVLTFTDLVLPGNAGMDLSFGRTYNHNSAPSLQWTFGPAGFPLRVQFPDGPPIDASPPLYPRFYTADGAEHLALPRTEAGPLLDTVFITAEFWRWDRTTHSLELPNGWTLSFSPTHSIGTAFRMAYLEELRDPFGNRVTFEWDGASPKRLERVKQWFGEAHRLIEFDYDGASPGLPRWMRYNGRQWLFSSSSAQPPIGPSWTFDSSDGLLVTTPQGGTIRYRFGGHYFQRLQPPRDGLPEQWVEVWVTVVKSREAGGHALSGGTWTFDYHNVFEDGRESEETTVTYPDARRLILEHGPTAAFSWQNLVTGYSIRRRTLFAADNNLQEDIRYDYEALPVGDDGYAPISFSAALKRRTLTRTGQTFTTEHSYSGDHFGDYHHPYKTVESGDAGQRTTLTDFDYAFVPWIKGRVRSSTVSTPEGGTFGSAADHDDNTGFTETETRYGVTITKSPTPEGNVGGVTDGHGHTTAFVYEWGVLRDTLTPEYSIERTINHDGTVASEKRRGFTTTYEYDGGGRIEWVKPPQGHWFQIAYDNEMGRWIERRRLAGEDGQRTTFHYDGFGRLLETKTAEGVRMRRSYDVYGRTAYQSQPYTDVEQGTEYSYDALDRLKTVSHTADGLLATYAYPSGIDVTITEHTATDETRTTTQRWRAFGDVADARLMSTTDGEGEKFSYSYDAIGQLTEVQQPRAPSRTWAYYPGTSLLKSETHPESRTTTYTYDSGRLATKRDARGQEFVYRYDRNDRLRDIDVIGSTADDVTFDYDASDNRTLIKNELVRSEFSFDAGNRLYDRRDRWTTGADFQTRYFPDDWDRLKSIQYPSGVVVTYWYDFDGRITRVLRGDQDLAVVEEHHPSGAIARLRYANQIVETFGEDDRGRMKSIGGGPVRLTYEYDRVGNVKQITEGEKDRSSYSQTFEYDRLDRLRRITGFGATSYTYDPLGNRRTQSNLGLTYDYDGPSQRLASVSGPQFHPAVGSYGYEDNGNTARDPSGTYTYTPFNMVATATVAGQTSAYAYDGDNQRAMRTVDGRNELFVRDPAGRLLSEFSTRCNSVKWDRDYVYIGERLVASIRDSSVSVSFTTTETTVAEDAGVVSLNVVLTAPSPLPCAMQVHFATQNGSATAGQDYVAASGTVTFGAGETTGAERQIVVTVLNDSRDDPPPHESFVVRLTDVSDGSLGERVIHTIAVEDDDVPEVTVEDAQAVEGQSLSFSLRLSSVADGPVTLRCYTLDGSAVNGVDYDSPYSPVAAGYVTIPQGARWAAFPPLLARADTVMDLDETLSLVCHTLSANAQWWDNVALGTIFQPAPGDFNADGFSDLLLQQANAVGDAFALVMGGVQIQGSRRLGPEVSDARWQVVGTPDLNRDGFADILWRHSHDTNGDGIQEGAGDLYTWMMPIIPPSGTMLFEPSSVAPLNPSRLSDLGWRLRATGFFNADPVADLLWQHATQDYIAVWTMQDGPATKGTHLLDSVLTTPASIDADTWRIVGAGDFNGDGKSDIVWQDQVQGWLAVWLMDGTTLLPEGSVSLSPNRVADTNWKVTGVGDFNRDGKPDLVWRDTTPGTGWIVVWLMNGTNLMQSIATTPERWGLELRIAGPK